MKVKDQSSRLTSKLVLVPNFSCRYHLQPYVWRLLLRIRDVLGPRLVVNWRLHTTGLLKLASPDLNKLHPRTQRTSIDVLVGGGLIHIVLSERGD